MEDDIKRIVEKKKNYFPAVALCECILAVLLIAGAFVLKYFFSEAYSKAASWYRENVMVETTVSDIIEEASDEN